MRRFALRHWTALLVVLIIVLWAVFYLPTTPSWTIYRMKSAVDARNGTIAATYVDFPSVVRNAGYQVVKKKSGGLIGELFGKSAVDMLSAPAAALAQSWTEQQVNNGSKDVQIPGWAVVGAIATLKRNGNSAATHFKDKNGRTWGVELARGDDGRWRLVRIDNIGQLIENLENRSGAPDAGEPSLNATPDAGPTP